MFRGRRLMNRMAIRAHDIRACVRTTPDVRPANLIYVASEAVVERLLGRQIGKGDDLRFVALCFHVSAPRPVAAFAALLLKFRFFIAQ